ncbi:MAG: insulinase family protein, partial [Thermoguttaceae bacterium]|nr:insulinase family protein [Thermoguttaceae bacterium]
EEESQRGLAHFLEHMAFNGSRNFKPGDLIPFFQRHGMNFGGDTNAHTTLDETVYKLNLAASDKAALAEGLKVLRDMADGLDLSPEEVDKERGVILAEKKARESEAAEAGRKWRRFVFAGHRLANDVIGTEETLAGADARERRIQRNILGIKR